MKSHALIKLQHFSYVAQVAIYPLKVDIHA